MQNINVLSKAPLQNFSNQGISGFFRLFKYEIIKIIIFLFIFFASVIYVNSESKVYYGDKSPVLGKF
jgi:capsule polysaccharide export protein KpsE/RkpR